MMTRRTLIGGPVLAAACLAAGAAAAADPVLIGEINSYSRFPAFTLS